MSCRYVARDQPRALLGYHLTECADETCKGCLPCPDAHCRVCARVHAEQTCADCLHDVRTDLAEIVRLVAGLPAEAEVKGIDSEAMNLLGPAADWEAWHHVQASITVGRLPRGWAESADHELHPLLVLGGWDSCVRDSLEHSEPEGRVTVEQAADYIGRQLTYLAGYVDLPFEDIARDLRRCRAHIERVLHDGEQLDTGAPCMTCRVPLLRVYGTEPALDGWMCPRCRRESSEDQYRLAVLALHGDESDWLTDQECQIRYGVLASTVRSWGRTDGPVRRRRHSGRTEFAKADIEREATRRGLLA